MDARTRVLHCLIPDKVTLTRRAGDGKVISGDHVERADDFREGDIDRVHSDID